MQKKQNVAVIKLSLNEIEEQIPVEQNLTCTIGGICGERGGANAVF